MRLIALLLGCVLFALPAPAGACSCGGWGDLPAVLREARDEASVIVHGRVVSVASGQVTIEVIEAFKGAARGARLVVDKDDSDAGRGQCAYAFESGREYLVYASRYEGELATSICTRTREVSKGDAELDWLRTGRLPPVPVALWRDQAQSMPKESMTAARCMWSSASTATCLLGKELQPLAPKTATPWVLVCTPHGDGFVRAHLCQVVPGDTVP